MGSPISLFLLARDPTAAQVVLMEILIYLGTYIGEHVTHWSA